MTDDDDVPRGGADEVGDRPHEVLEALGLEHAVELHRQTDRQIDNKQAALVKGLDPW